MKHQLFAYKGHKSHETSPLDGILDGALKRRAIAAAFAAEKLALAGAHLLHALHVLVINERRAGTAFLGAETATILPATS
jgi:hypothetical protein